MLFGTDHFNRANIWLGLCCCIAAVAYLPVLNNGFIADDYVILQRTQFLQTEPLYLYQVPPENFRFVSYLVFGVLKGLAGYQAWLFYAVNLGLHIANVILFGRFLRTLIEDEWTVRLAMLLFAVFQAPQEAVMWLAAMNETTLFFFTLLTLLAWSRKRYVFAAMWYLCALFSKESAIIIPVLILLLDWYQHRRLPGKRHLLLLLPSAVFAAIFLTTVSNNFMLTNRSYAFGLQAIPVIAVSLHRLAWPWIYVVIVLAWVKTRRLPSLPVVAAYLGLVAVMMLPYAFIVYQTSLPSRQLYLASAVLMTMFAVLTKPLRGSPILKVLVVSFVGFNIAYLWLRKDGQFEERAAPTTQLIQMMRRQQPQKIVIRNFAYPYPEIATATTLAVPGWSPGLISTEDRETLCDGCLELLWNKGELRYDPIVGK